MTETCLSWVGIETYPLTRHEKLPQTDGLRLRIRSNARLFKPGRSEVGPRLAVTTKGSINPIDAFNLLHIQITLVYSLYKFFNTFPCSQICPRTTYLLTRLRVMMDLARLQTHLEYPFLKKVGDLKTASSLRFETGPATRGRRSS
jgi:hypothetical protein